MEGDERKFLHDLASPLGTAVFIMDALTETFSGSADEKVMISQAQEALDKVQKLLQERRVFLVKKGPNNG